MMLCPFANEVKNKLKEYRQNADNMVVKGKYLRMNIVISLKGA